MYGKTHLVIALVIVLILYNYLLYFIPVDIVLICICSCLIGSLLPDIDHPNGTIRRLHSIILSMTFIAYVVYKSGFAIYHVVPSICMLILIIYSLRSEHRTFTHSILCSLLYSLCIFPFTIQGSIYFLIGYSSHLLSDSFTKTGTPFFYPFKKKRYGIKLITVGALVENIIFAVGILLCLYLAGKILLVNYDEIFRT